MICIGVICTVISYLYPICRADWTIERQQFINYVYNIDTSCYRLGASGENGCYDCTGIIWSYFKSKIADGYKPITKLNTREMRGEMAYGELEEILPDTAKTGDLVLHIPIEGKSIGTHTAIFVKYMGGNQIMILDTFTHKNKLSTRIVPYKHNLHKIHIIQNPRID